MREKSVSIKTAGRYIDFVYSIRENAFPYDCQVPLTEIAINNGVSKSAPTALVTLGIIKKENSKTWIFISEKPTREIALELLNYLLEKNKKQRVTPIAGMEDLVTAINRSVEAMNKNTVEINNALRVFKSPKIESVVNGDLFQIEDQRLKIACAIATGYYSNQMASYDVMNDFIILATDDLLSKLLNNN